MSEIEAVSVTSITSRAGSTPWRSSARSMKREHVAIDNGQRGEVHGDAAIGEVAVASQPSRDLLDDDPVDLADQAVTLGRGRKLAGPITAPPGSSARRKSASWWATRPSASETIGW